MMQTVRFARRAAAGREVPLGRELLANSRGVTGLLHPTEAAS